MVDTLSIFWPSYSYNHAIIWGFYIMIFIEDVAHCWKYENTSPWPKATRNSEIFFWRALCGRNIINISLMQQKLQFMQLLKTPQGPSEVYFGIFRAIFVPVLMTYCIMMKSWIGTTCHTCRPRRTWVPSSRCPRHSSRPRGGTWARPSHSSSSCRPSTADQNKKSSKLSSRYLNSWVYIWLQVL